MFVNICVAWIVVTCLRGHQTHGVQAIEQNTNDDAAMLTVNTKTAVPEVTLNFIHNTHVHCLHMDGNLIVISDHIVYAVDLEREPQQLTAVAKFDLHQNEALIDVQAADWKGVTIFVATTESRHIVYSTQYISGTDVLERVEQIAGRGKHIKTILVKDHQQLYCLFGSVFTEQEGKIMLFSWTSSAFSLITTINTISMTDVQVFDAIPENIIVMVIKQSAKEKTSIITYSLRNGVVNRLQNLYVDAVTILTYTYDGIYFFLACKRVGECSVFMMQQQNKFQDIRKRSFAGGPIAYLASNRKSIAALQTDTLMFYNNPQLNDGDLVFKDNFDAATDLFVHEKVNTGVIAVALVYLNPDRINIFRLHSAGRSASKELEKELSASDCLEQLRDGIKSRIFMLPTIINKTNHLLRTDQHQTISYLNAPNVVVHNSNITTMKINMSGATTPIELLNGVAQLEMDVNELKMFRLSRKQRNSDEIPTTFRNVSAHNIIFDGDIFKNLLYRSKNISLYESVSTNVLNAKKTTSIGSANTFRAGSMRDLRIRNLKIKTLNEIPWSEFFELLFLRGRHNSIDGNLISNAPVFIKSLQADFMDAVPIDAFFTKSTPQRVTSNVIFSRFHSRDLTTTTINGVDIEKDVARIQNDITFLSPIKIRALNISGDLELSEHEDNDTTRQIIGTKLEDLSQIYNGQVKIEGRLILSDVTFANPQASKIVVNGVPFNMKVQEDFWMKSIDQDLTSVHFKGIVKAPQIFVKTLSGESIENYVINEEKAIGPVSLIFLSAIVEGDITFGSDYVTELQKIQATAVFRNRTNIITAEKRFDEVLQVNELHVKYLNNEMFETMFPQNLNEVRLTRKQRINQLTILGDLHTTSTRTVQHFNGVAVPTEFTYIDEQIISLNSATFDTLNVATLSANWCDTLSLDKMKSVSELERQIPYVRVENGDATFSDTLHVITLNDMNVNDYLALVVDATQSSQIGGHKQFSGNIQVDGNFAAKKIADINVQEWMSNALQKREPQAIRAPWIIQNVYCKGLDATVVNGVHAGDFIYTTSGGIVVRTDVYVPKLVVNRDFHRTLPCNVDDVTARLDKPLYGNWDTIIVHGHAEISGENSLIHNFITNVVRNGVDQTISAEVTLDNGHIYQLYTDTYLEGFNLAEIEADAVKKYSAETQIIAGAKIFNTIAAKSLCVEDNFMVTFVNDINIPELNASIYRPNSYDTISGVKRFVRPLGVRNLHANGTIDGTAVDNIAFANSGIPIECVTFKSVVCEEMYVNDVNEYSLNEFLKKRILLDGPPHQLGGTIQFEMLVLNNTKMNSINYIRLDDILLMHLAEPQFVSGKKIVENKLNVDGSIDVHYLNGYDVNALYSNSIRLDSDYYLKRLEATDGFTNAGLYPQLINQVPINEVMAFSRQSLADVFPNNKYIRSPLQLSPLAAKSRFLYLERASEFTIVTENPPNDSLHNSDNQLFHIQVEHYDDDCGLSPKCKCPFTATVIITAYGKIFIHHNEYFVRELRVSEGDVTTTARTTHRTNCVSPVPNNSTMMLNWHGYLTEIEFIGRIIAVRMFQSDIDNSTYVVYGICHNGVGSSFVATVRRDQWISGWEPTNTIYVDGLRAFDLMVLRNQQKVLIISEEPQRNHTHGSVKIYIFEPANKVFMHIGTVPADANLMHGIAIDRKVYLLFLAMEHHKYVTVLQAQYHSDSKLLTGFSMYQKMMFDVPIKRMHLFTLQSEHFAVFIFDNDEFQLLQYQRSSGWTMVARNYISFLQDILPFELSGNIFLLAMSRHNAIVLEMHAQKPFDIV